ncbi:hypothetical protein SAMN05216464_1044 [Mucilaginibacter pineti]|uniref:Uncharacterized protein n=1 Tax=Mucilaginibacter pineti TaxID=1391627 RepID=A0A1G7A8W3_9SPHI|nr:hypothetical protein [Mucilaginibacter pineti]SDE11252.1 hypothetical protein SAMN05216464_1044 [Mucilaginibacter pineti]
MIPEQFKQNTELNIEVYGHPVSVKYAFYYPEKRIDDQADPLVSHIEYRAESAIISETGYRSHFFHTEALHYCMFKSIQELVINIAEGLAREQGYQPPAPTHQLRLF